MKLGALEELVLLTVRTCGTSNFAKIRKHLNESLGTEYSSSAIYTILYRLRLKGFISMRDEDFNRPYKTRVFTITVSGVGELTRVKSMRQKLGSIN